MTAAPESGPAGPRHGFSRTAGLGLAILCALFFAAGWLASEVVERWTAEGGEGAGLGSAHLAYFDRFAEDFGLDERQRALLRLVLEEKERRKREWWNDYMQRPGNAAEREGLLQIDRLADRRIREILTPEQRKRYERMLARRPGD